MVEVEKYIKRLLLDQDCVIIPDFGGVLIQYSPARFEPESGQYLPSRRTAAFNEVLKMDDGLLAKYISENEDMSYAEAHGHIREFVKTVRSLLSKKHTILLEGVGAFSLNPEGRLQFHSDNSFNFHPEFFGLPPVKTMPADQKTSEPVALPVSVGASVAIDLNEKQTVRRIPWGNWVSAASIAVVLVYVSFILSNEPGAKSSLSPLETLRTLVVKAPHPSVNEVVKSERVVFEPEAIVATPESSPGYKPAENVLETPAEVATEAVAKSPVAAEKNFYLVAAVYESTASLDKYGTMMSERLKTDGFEDVSMLKVRDKYMLTAGAFSSWREAQKAISPLRNTAKGAWIYEH